MLGVVALVDHDGGRSLYRGLLLLLLTLTTQHFLQRSVRLLILLLVQPSASDALDLTPRLTTCTALQSSQRQLDRCWRDDGVLVVVLLFGLSVQFGGQLGVGLFQVLQQLVSRSAVVVLLLLTALLLVATLPLLVVLVVLSPLASLSLLTVLDVLLLLVIVLVLLIVVSIVVSPLVALTLSLLTLSTLALLLVVSIIIITIVIPVLSLVL